ncbi:MAG: hypothetical protein ACK56I_15315 [bacterium]
MSRTMRMPPELPPPAPGGNSRTPPPAQTHRNCPIANCGPA